MGAAAPDFSATDSQGWTRRLAEFRGWLSSGAVGRLYHAKTTPHMFVIDAQGELRYMGGIDRFATADTADIAKPSRISRRRCSR